MLEYRSSPTSLRASRKKVARFGSTTLVAAEPGEAHSGAQFPELGVLLLSDVQRFMIELLGGFGMPLTNEQLALVPVELRF